MKSPQLRIVALTFLLAALIAVVPAGAADLLVGPGQTYETIQAAVDAAASGDAIIIDPGTYPEQVLVDAKDLTITGAGQGLTVIVAPDTLQSFYTTAVDHYPVLGVRASVVDLSGVTIDGAGKGGAHEQFFGLIFRNAGGSATGVEITGVRNEPLDAAPHGVGLAVDNDDTVARSLTVDGCLIQDCQKNAVSVLTTAGTALTLAMTGNEIVGAGPTSAIVQNGIEISGGDVAVTLDANTVRDLAWLGGNSTATGILLRNCTGTATGNTLTGCQSGLHLNAAAVNASTNQITVPRPTDFGYGVRVDNTDPAYAKSGATSVRPPSPFRGDWQRRAAKATLAISITGNTVALDPAVDDPAGTLGLRAANNQGYDDLDVTVTGNTFTGFETATAAAETAPTTGVWLAADYGDNIFQACGAGLVSDLAITVAAETVLVGRGRRTRPATAPARAAWSPASWTSTPGSPISRPSSASRPARSPRPRRPTPWSFTYTGGASGRINGYSIDVVWDPAVATAAADRLHPPAQRRLLPSEHLLRARPRPRPRPHRRGPRRLGARRLRRPLLRRCLRLRRRRASTAPRPPSTWWSPRSATASTSRSPASCTAPAPSSVDTQAGLPGRGGHRHHPRLGRLDRRRSRPHGRGHGRREQPRLAALRSGGLRRTRAGAGRRRGGRATPTPGTSPAPAAPATARSPPRSPAWTPRRPRPRPTAPSPRTTPRPPASPA